MAVKIRLARGGRKKNPFYQIVVADARAPRDGKFIENIGSYNPMTKPATIELDREKAFDWLMKGAQPTNTARAIMKFKGVFYKKHLQRGVDKGALTQEKADEMYQSWVDAKEAKVAERVAQSKVEREEWLKAINGTATKKVVEHAPAVEASEDFQNVEVTAEAPVEAAPTAETEAPAEETPAGE